VQQGCRNVFVAFFAISGGNDVAVPVNHKRPGSRLRRERPWRICTIRSVAEKEIVLDWRGLFNKGHGLLFTDRGEESRDCPPAPLATAPQYGKEQKDYLAMAT
jgi:hypothetical protein